MQKYQTFNQRFWASLIDLFIIAVPLALLNIWVTTFGLSKFVPIVWVVFSLSAIHIYEILMHGIYGQTLGKMVKKVKVVDDISEAPITMRQSILRSSVPLLLAVGFMFNSIYLILFDIALIDNSNMNGADVVLTILMWVWIIVDVVTFLRTTKQRAAHDLIAGSVVIRLDLD